MQPKILKFLSNFFQYRSFFILDHSKDWEKSRNHNNNNNMKNNNNIRGPWRGSSDPKSQHWNNQNTNPMRKIVKFLISTSLTIPIQIYLLFPNASPKKSNPISPFDKKANPSSQFILSDRHINILEKVVRVRLVCSLYYQIERLKTNYDSNSVNTDLALN